MSLFSWTKEETYPVDLETWEIKKFLKHRYPFLMIDKVSILSENECFAYKSIGNGDHVFCGHFPGYPIMPGVLQLEAMAQSACVLSGYHMRHRDLDHNTLLAKIDSARFYQKVLPGEILTIHTHLKKYAQNIAQFESACYIKSVLVANAQFKAAIELTEEYTLAIIKPNAFEHKEHIISILKQNALKIASYYEKQSATWIPAYKVITFTQEIARQFYAEHKEKGFFNDLCNFICTGPSLVLVLKGKDAIQRYRKIIGETDPKNALQGTIRSIYGKSIDENAVHGSDSQESAKREISIHFPDKFF